MTPGFMTALISVTLGTLSVVLAVLVIRWFDRQRNGVPLRSHNMLEAGPEPIIFLFRGAQLIDGTTPARALMDNVGGPGSDFTRLKPWLEQRFPDLDTKLTSLAARGRIDLSGALGTGSARQRLIIEDLGEATLRVSLSDPTAENAGITIDSLTLQAMEEELHTLRGSMDQTPMLAWRQDDQGQITWANAAYMGRATELTQGDLSWPPPRLIELPSLAQDAGRAMRRAQLDLGGTILWFDCHAHRSGNQTMFFALPADAAVRAERGLRDFVQTLTKTFADLPTGLAIFDRDRNLQLFNPSLIDLTGLSASFLTARPTLFDFLDKLREARMVPEPKDYRSWRQQMSNLETAAATGRHVETWSLPGGQTYRVTGRPHPDGAVAFLFEDITSEVSLTRKFRAELNLGSDVLNGIDDAVAVFGTGGQFLLCNRAYNQLWGKKSSSLRTALMHWRENIDAGPGFGVLENRLTHSDSENRRDTGAMAAPDGRMMSWTVTSLAGGRQLVRFRQQDSLDLAAPATSGATHDEDAGQTSTETGDTAQKALGA